VVPNSAPAADVGAALSGVFSQAVALAWDANKHLGERGGVGENYRATRRKVLTICIICNNRQKKSSQ